MQDGASGKMLQNNFKSAMLFDGIRDELEADGANLVKKVNGVFAFKVKGDHGGEAKWIVDAKHGKGDVVFDGEAVPDATLQATDSDMFDLLSGKLNPQIAFLRVSRPSHL